jgi:hypothetical protein
MLDPLHVLPDILLYLLGHIALGAGLGAVPFFNGNIGDAFRVVTRTSALAVNVAGITR